MMTPPIIILGMHRSGTTLCTRILQECGVHIGADVEENLESLYFLRIHQMLLRKSNAWWDSPEALRESANDPAFASRLYEDLKFAYMRPGFLKSYLGKKTFDYIFKPKTFRWAWKNPRATLYYKVWRQLNKKSKFIFLYRNGIDVAESLYQRETRREQLGKPWISNRCLTRSGCFSLWEEYNSQFLDVHESYQHSDNILLIAFENLLSNTRETLMEIISFCELVVSEDIINSLAESINSDRAFAFKANNLTEKYKDDLSQSKAMAKLGYVQS